MKKQHIELLRDLCQCDGVSGYEDEIREHIMARLRGKVDEMIVDAQGNLIVFKRGEKRRKEKMLVCAHMDEVGMLIRGITDDGMLKFATVGGIDPRVMIGRRMKVGKNKIRGVISIKAIHLTSPEDRKIAPAADTLYIDIGANSAADAEKYTHIGDYATFDTDFVEFGDKRIKAKAIDDRLGCAVMVAMIEEGLLYDTWFSFNVGEEIGSRGAKTATAYVNPDLGIAIEGTTAGDVHGVAEHMRSTYQGGGAAVSIIDKSSVYNREFVRRITDAADKEGIKWHYRASQNGSTDAGTIHQNGNGALAFGVAAPVRYIHSAVNVLYTPDFDEVLKLAMLYVKEAKLNA